jgi:predicted RND superfamily exporter protein
MVPYTSFMTLEKTKGANEITRYNMYNSASIRGSQAKGYTTGDAIKAIREVAKDTLSREFDIAWEGLSYDEAKRGNEFVVISLIVVFFVYLVLAAQYESFVLPFAVLFSLPVGIFGSFSMLKLMGLANDVYAQIAMITLLGLLGKNAVLIVEFAVQKRNEGLSLRDAAMEGARMRFRPILMTSFAFVAGLVPLVLSTGAGAVGNRTLGSSAMGGMITGTLLGVLVIPGLYFVFATLVDGKNLLQDQDHTSITEFIARRKKHRKQKERLIKQLVKKTKKNEIAKRSQELTPELETVVREEVKNEISKRSQEMKPEIGTVVKEEVKNELLKRSLELTTGIETVVREEVGIARNELSQRSQELTSGLEAVREEVVIVKTAFSQSVQKLTSGLEAVTGEVGIVKDELSQSAQALKSGLEAVREEVGIVKDEFSLSAQALTSGLETVRQEVGIVKNDLSQSAQELTSGLEAVKADLGKAKNELSPKK